MLSRVLKLVPPEYQLPYTLSDEKNLMIKAIGKREQKFD
jgi:hypothetical protein